MMLKELRNTDPEGSLPKIAFSETENIWVSGYWDGAKSGMLRYREEYYWFEMIQENEEEQNKEWYRRFAIVKLSEEQLKKEFEVHEDFQRFVGTHWDGKQVKTPPKFEVGRSSEFYEKHGEYCRSRPFGENTVIGWMEN